MEKDLVYFSELFCLKFINTVLFFKNAFTLRNFTEQNLEKRLCSLDIFDIFILECEQDFLEFT